MTNWPKKEFESVYEIPSRNGLSKPSKVRGTGYKMINMGELFSNNRIYDIDMELVPLTDAEKEKAKVEPGDLLFARQSLVAEGAGKCIIVMETSDLTVFESHIIRVRLNKEHADPLFYYYYFRSPASPMKTIVQHCVQAGIKASDLSKLEVIVPPLSEQQKIASIFNSIDAKIENNNRINQNLAEQIRTLCNAWLIDYEPFGGKCPDNWELTQLSSFAEFTSGYSYKGNELQSSSVAMATIKNFDRKGGFKLDGYKEIIPSSKLKVDHHAELFDTLVARHLLVYLLDI